MMNTTYETYMNALKQGLASFDSAAAEEILNDFESISPTPAARVSPMRKSVRNSAMSTMSSNFSVRNMPQRSSLLQTCCHRRKPTPILKKHNPNYPYAPSTAITAMEISLRNASADFAPGTSASVEFDFSGDFDPDLRSRHEA